MIRSVFFILSIICSAQIVIAQFDPAKPRLVYRIAEMDQVETKKNNVFKIVNDTSLTFNIYYPSAFKNTEDLPLVIFNNGVGSLQLPDWNIYQDWAKLMAANGLIAVTHQSRRGKSLKDSEDLLDYIQNHAKELHVDQNRIGIWACSGNVGAGLPLSMQENRKYIRALAMYYGAGWREEDNVVKRQDLEILIVRAGLDFYNLNRSIETFIKNALLTDAHIQFINYPEGQHAFDAMDDNNRSREIIKQTVEFFKAKLSREREPNEYVLTNVRLWEMVLNEKNTEHAIIEFKKALLKYREMPGHSPWFNHIIDERNLNQLGYELVKTNRTEDAIKIFKANQEAFPESPNGYDALADAYQQKGDKTETIKYAKLALKKLEQSQNLSPQYKEAIRESVQSKIDKLGGGK